MTLRSEQINELATALCAAQAEFTAIPKDSVNPFFKSNYAGLASVVKAATPILTKHGLSVSQFIGYEPDPGGGYDTLATWLMHTSGQFIAESMRLRPPKDDAQGQGSATTYGRRYAYMAALGLVADEDDDGNKASRQSNGSAKADRESRPVHGTHRVVTARDIEEIQAALSGLSVAKIQLAFGSVGLDPTRPYGSIPAEKAVPLVKALAGAKG